MRCILSRRSCRSIIRTNASSTSRHDRSHRLYDYCNGKNKRINKKRKYIYNKNIRDQHNIRSRQYPDAFEAWNAMQWNGMKWNGMKSLAPWTIKLSRTTRLSARTVAEMTRLCPLLVSRREYIWNALFDVPTWKKFTCSLEMCGEMQEIGIETSRNRPPFHRSKAASCTERNLATPVPTTAICRFSLDRTSMQSNKSARWQFHSFDRRIEE